MTDESKITVELDLPQFEWPDNDPTKAAVRLAMDIWLADFYSEHKRMPDSAQIVEACYALGGKDQR